MAARNVTHHGFIVLLYVSGIICLVVAVVLHVKDDEVPLVISTYILAGYILGSVTLSVVWERLSDKSNDPQKATNGDGVFDLSKSMSQAVNLFLTVQGVVLGLVFAFIPKADVTDTIKVGSVALGFGVLVGLLLYSLVAIQVKGDGPTVIAGFLFNVMSWALAYGLVCIVASVVARN